MTTSLRTTTMSVHIVMREPEEPETLNAFSARFRRLSSLIWVSSIIDQGDEAFRGIGPDQRPGGLPIARSGESTASATVRQFRVGRLTYESPLDLVLEYWPWIAAGGGGTVGASALRFFGAGNKAIDLWERFDQSRVGHRVRHSDADLHVSNNEVEIAKNKAEKEAIEKEAIEMVWQAMQISPSGQTPSTQQKVRDVGRVLPEIEAIEMTGELEEG